MNCSTSTIGMTTAVALLPLRGTADRAMPSSAEVATPSTNTHANVSHASGSVGSSMPSTSHPAEEQQRRLQRAGHEHLADLAEEVADTGESGVPPSRFSVPSPFSVAMSTARFCTPDSSMPAASMPGR